ncbi:hypothetical protein KQ302_10745 [Synechococcus sp. CS-602]|uniref:hypothetical protein n=1 Tax=Synechococcaceae TaxID=1890426 RepID=UPI00119CE89C|nr:MULTISPECIES: hypothetical protein [Synechococcaceae]MCT4365809.1 hypothetical protein [Candidatus Regnicoccus frigidus MAG-AL1]MCT0201005.1 hypothetical protein [Synechococcus sp. CS-603]MCT0205572.1 hypothetical protein [Synechococcus sp. CS-602]MCT0246891.1 hypothetical protein [Synechococcus sp. CS-601]MCT4366529.1 hypothetical protein [Candidatus Regnicoccus frigidus MAG-AL2]
MRSARWANEDWRQSFSDPIHNLNAMIRILGDRDSLLAALTAHWADQSIGLSAPPQAADRFALQRRVQGAKSRRSAD